MKLLFLFLLAMLLPSRGVTQINLSHLEGKWTLNYNYCTSYFESAMSKCFEYPDEGPATREFLPIQPGFNKPRVIYNGDKVFDYEVDSEENTIYTDFGMWIVKESIIKLSAKNLVIINFDVFFNPNTDAFEYSGKVFIMFFEKIK